MSGLSYTTINPGTVTLHLRNLTSFAHPIFLVQAGSWEPLLLLILCYTPLTRYIFFYQNTMPFHHQ
jgi:hypothetical protein